MQQIKREDFKRLVSDFISIGFTSNEAKKAALEIVGD